MKERDETALWREAFATASPTDRPGPDCPPAERIWEAARNEATPAELRQLLAHVATCTVCTEAWRLAMELKETETVRPQDTGRPQENVRGHHAQWLAAASIAVVLGGLVLRGGMSPPSVDRSVERVELELVTDGGGRSRDRCLLRWTAFEGGIYDVIVSTQDLDPISEASGLEEPEYLVPEDDLAKAPEGEALSVHVEAYSLSEGAIASRTLSFQCD